MRRSFAENSATYTSNFGFCRTNVRCLSLGLLAQLAALRKGSARERALRNVSFEVQPGEAVGIVGHNGAGKSTILKLLSGITVPTSGEISIRGRVAALVEVSAGFHPELTGRRQRCASLRVDPGRAVLGDF